MGFEPSTTSFWGGHTHHYATGPLVTVEYYYYKYHPDQQTSNNESEHCSIISIGRNFDKILGFEFRYWPKNLPMQADAFIICIPELNCPNFPRKKNWPGVSWSHPKFLSFASECTNFSHSIIKKISQFFFKFSKILWRQFCTTNTPCVKKLGHLGSHAADAILDE